MQQITCSNKLPGGILCGEPAALVSTQFVYHQEYTQGEFEQVLSEIHYNISCPRCGEYTVVKTGGDFDEVTAIPTERDSATVRMPRRQLNGGSGGNGGRK